MSVTVTIPTPLRGFTGGADAVELAGGTVGEVIDGLLAAHGGLTGVPQVSVPGAEVNGLPVGLSILAARGADATLVAVARALDGAR